MLKKDAKYLFKKHFPKLAYYLNSLRSKDAVLRNIFFNNYKFDLIFDVGGHIGLYAHGVRHNGFAGRIVSFEPQKEAFEIIKDFSKNDKLWEVENFALGDFNGTAEMNISENSVSSSILDVNQQSINLVPSIRTVKKEKIEVKTLDSIIYNYFNLSNRLFVKIDAQGFEKKIIAGSLESLKHIPGFQIEMTFKELYAGEPKFLELLEYMNELGYKLVNLESGWHNWETGEMMEIDGIFIKKELVK